LSSISSFYSRELTLKPVEVRVQIPRDVWSDLRRLAVLEKKPAYAVVNEALFSYVRARLASISERRQGAGRT